jgi:flavin-binding protein dodecin
MATSDHTYKIVELVGSSSSGVQEAIDNAIARAGQTLRHLDWFEVREIRGTINDGSASWYQVKLGVGFRIVDAEDINRE